MTKTTNTNNTSDVPETYNIFDKKDAAKLGAKLWDEILKSVVKRSPSQLIPLVNEFFHQSYSADADISFLSTEYTALHKEKHDSIFSDITFQINHDKIYHLESQMKQESDIMLRMVEYNFSIALQHNTQFHQESGILSIQLPASAIIYPAASTKHSQSLSCQLLLPDGSSFTYPIKTIHIQQYSLEELHQKHLTLFFPYTLLRFRSRLKSKQNPLTKNELTEFVNALILDLEDEMQHHNISTAQYNDYIYLIDRAADRIFSKYDTFKKEVSNMTECRLILPSERMEQMEQVINSFQNTIKEKDDILAATIKEKDSLIESLQKQLAEAKQQA